MKTVKDFVSVEINSCIIGRIRTQTIFLDGKDKGHLADGREVIKTVNGWVYRPS